MNHRLLILDDDEGILEAYAAILSPKTNAPVVRSSRASTRTQAAVAPVLQPVQYEVTYTKTGLEAISAIEQAYAAGLPYAGGFFDVKLGGELDGIDTIRRIKDIDPDLLCVLVTAYQDRSIEDITNVFGATFSDRWDFLNKPFTKAEILQKANNLTANWDRRRREKEYIEKIKAQQEQLIRAERLAAVGTMARGIGHEFGNILLSIMGHADLALQSKDPAQMEEALKLVGKSSERAAIIIRNLQSMVKTEPKREKVDLVLPIKEALELVGHEIKKKAIKVTEQYAPDLPKTVVNRVEIGQVFLNLIINAIHAMGNKGGEIRITADADENTIRIMVADSGCGITEENLAKIFEPLFTTKGNKGSGIGLSVSKKIIENHGGHISVRSEVGKGTVFLIQIPVT